MDSTTSLMSGEYPVEHQSGRAAMMNADGPLLQELLQDSGYRTGAITCNPFLSPPFGFGTGFDQMVPITQINSRGMNMRRFYSDTKDLPAWKRYLAFLEAAIGKQFVANIQNALQFRFGLFDGEDDGGAELTARALDFIDATGDVPWFLYLHYSETHMNSSSDVPYAVPEEHLYRFVSREDVRDAPLKSRTEPVDYDPATRDVHERLYDGALRYLDSQVERLVDALQAADAYKDTLVVVTADHGELLGEHGLLGHGYLYEPGVRVPLVMKLPANDPRRGNTIDDRVNTIALYRTLLEYVDGPTVPEHARGGNLLEERPELVLTQDYSNSWSWSRYEDRIGDQVSGMSAIYRNERKLILRGDEEELYDLPNDPDETNDLSEDRKELARGLRRQLEDTLRQLGAADDVVGGDLDVDESTRNRLADLGYL